MISQSWDRMWVNDISRDFSEKEIFGIIASHRKRQMSKTYSSTYMMHLNTINIFMGNILMDSTQFPGRNGVSLLNALLLLMRINVACWDELPPAYGYKSCLLTEMWRQPDVKCGRSRFGSYALLSFFIHGYHKCTAQVSKTWFGICTSQVPGNSFMPNFICTLKWVAFTQTRIRYKLYNYIRLT